MAKGEIAQGLTPDGVFVVPGDSPYTPLWQGLAEGRRVSTFAMDQEADLWAASGSVRVRWDKDGFRTTFTANLGGDEYPLELRLAGIHNVRNALAAAATALALGVGIDAVRAGLLTLDPVPGRLCPRTCGEYRIIDDTYNANPDSLAAAVNVLIGLPGSPWLVLGDLAELGPDSLAIHREVGAQARAAGVERLFSVGTQSKAASDSFGAGARHFADHTALAAHLRDSMTTDTLVLIKGSRSARMERVLTALCDE
jgi:UDP-N-acetylmuramoyl-tripeptide--D-alanyl-D-alanine ligase